jgi:hypothetical protein
MNQRQYSKHVEICQEDNDAGILEMMKRPKKYSLLLEECPGCRDKVDSFDSIYVFTRCDHWACLNCIDTMIEDSMKSICFPWVDCFLCGYGANLPNWDEDIRVVVERDTEAFQDRFSKDRALKRRREYTDPDEVLEQKPEPTKNTIDILALKGMITTSLKPDIGMIKSELETTGTSLSELDARVQRLEDMIQQLADRISKLE